MQRTPATDYGTLKYTIFYASNVKLPHYIFYLKIVLVTKLLEHIGGMLSMQMKGFAFCYFIYLQFLQFWQTNTNVATKQIIASKVVKIVMQFCV